MFLFKAALVSGFFYGGEGENRTLHTIDYKTTYSSYPNALYYNKL